jgi:hypothetical protein
MSIDRNGGATFMLDRDQLAVPGVRWVKVEAFDMQGHHASTSIAPDLSRPPGELNSPVPGQPFRPRAWRWRP